VDAVLGLLLKRDCDVWEVFCCSPLLLFSTNFLLFSRALTRLTLALFLFLYCVTLQFHYLLGTKKILNTIRMSNYRYHGNNLKTLDIMKNNLILTFSTTLMIGFLSPWNKTDVCSFELPPS
jgi:hypothetical protein